MRLRDDWETALWNTSPRSRVLGYKANKETDPWNGLPATIPTLKLFYTLSEAWQRFYFELCWLANHRALTMDEMLFAYRHLTKDSGGWRDRHTWNNVKDPEKVFTDYVLEMNMPPAVNYGDAAQQDLLSSGNIVKVIGEGRVSGESAWKIETLDPSLPPPPIDEIWGKWWLVGWCTVSGYNWDTGAKARLKFPFFNGYGAPLMVLGRGGSNVVAKSWCEPIMNGTEYNLYTV